VASDNRLKFYIDGAWVDPLSRTILDVIDPSTEKPFAKIALGSAADVDRAVKAARAAFPAYSQTSHMARVALLKRILERYQDRVDEMMRTISREMGAPLKLSIQAGIGITHLQALIESMETFKYEEQRGTTLVTREPIGVAGLITPWNWPIHQIVCKVAPALAAGCTAVLKPSEIAPLNAILFAEILHEAGVPPGVFNLVNGSGPTVGTAIASHPDIDMVSFTGSTRVGILVAKNAADTVKRVCQELGGKSANILLPDVDLRAAVEKGVAGCLSNSGQSCNAPTRMFVPADRHDEALVIARQAAERARVGDPADPTVDLGPVVSAAQYEKVQGHIEKAIAEGAELATGGPGRPAGLKAGYYVKPTIFGHVRPQMTIAREEVFGPVLAILPYTSEDEAVELANDSAYGLAAYVQSADLARARRVASKMRAGQVFINYPARWDAKAPFGGYKQSGNGREQADFGLAEFLETKAILGFDS
jgi:aldehyde dehydrogenase (NAD+)